MKCETWKESGLTEKEIIHTFEKLILQYKKEKDNENALELSSV